MRKYFPQDKNIILKGAQFDQREKLISHLIDFSKFYYQSMYNPLGLMDHTIETVQNHEGYDFEAFEEFYELLSAVYRYKFGSNQLEFLFDGLDHYTKYSREWKKCYTEWVTDLLGHEPFLKTVLQITVFKAEGHSRLLAISRLKNYLHQHFDLKFYKYRGIQKTA